MPRHIGIVGCSAEGAALCYKTICIEGSALFGPHAHPEVSMHTHPLSAYMKFINRSDWSGVAELMLSSAQKLAGIGADFVVCPDNTIHQALHFVAPRLPVPWLHIADVVALEANRRGFRCVAVLGTKWLMESSVYSERLTAADIQHVIPNASERDEITRIIMDELVCGVFKADSVSCFLSIIQRMKDEHRCDAVILGCTEIPLILNDENSPLPTLDSTRLLARAALHRAANT